MTNFDSPHFIKSILPNSSPVSLLSYCQCVFFMYTLWVSNNVISHVISPWTFFNFSPDELVIIVVWKICLCLLKIPKYTWINLAYTLWNVFEDSSIELILVMLIVEATWCRLDNHQTSSETQGSNQVCRPLKALSWQLLNCQSFWILIGPRSSLFSWQVRVKQVYQVLLCAQSHTRSSLTDHVCPGPFLHSRLALSLHNEAMFTNSFHVSTYCSLNLVNTLAWNFNVHKSYMIPSWTRLFIKLCCVKVMFLFTIPEIYYDDTLRAFLWGDLDRDQWSKICLDHGASKEPMNPCPEWIHQFFWCTMIRVRNIRSRLSCSWLTIDYCCYFLIGSLLFALQYFIALHMLFVNSVRGISWVVCHSFIKLRNSVHSEFLEFGFLPFDIFSSSPEPSFTIRVTMDHWSWSR